jgi:hypothetical protein
VLVNFVEWLSSDVGTSAILTVGDPACAFLVAYAAAVRWRAARRGIRPGTLSYLLAASAGVVIYLSGQVVALQLSSIAAAMAPPGDPDGTLESTWLAVVLLWPVAWCLLAVVILLAARGRLVPPVRSVVAALAVGLLVSLLTFVAQFDLGYQLPVQLRLPFFLALLTVSVGILVVASRRSRVRDVDPVAG